MKNHIPYDEGKIEHQQPIDPISAWQEWNDCSGEIATREALSDERIIGEMDTDLYERDIQRIKEDECSKP